MLTFTLAGDVRRFDAHVGDRVETANARWTLDGPRLTVKHQDKTVLSARVVRLTAAVLELEVDGSHDVPIYKRVEKKD